MASIYSVIVCLLRLYADYQSVCVQPPVPLPHLPSTKPNWMAFSLTWASDSAM